MRLNCRSKGIAVFLLVAAAACGGDASPTEPAPQFGTRTFRQDAATCTGTGVVELFVDGASQGRYTTGPGAQKDFQVAAGSHTTGAREIGGSNYVFPTQNVVVPANGTYITVLVCG
jgi:hypothetical protein